MSLSRICSVWLTKALPGLWHDVIIVMIQILPSKQQFFANAILKSSSDSKNVRFMKNSTISMELHLRFWYRTSFFCPLSNQETSNLSPDSQLGKIQNNMMHFFFFSAKKWLQECSFMGQALTNQVFFTVFTVTVSLFSVFTVLAFFGFITPW